MFFGDERLKRGRKKPKTQVQKANLGHPAHNLAFSHKSRLVSLSLGRVTAVISAVKFT